MLAVANRATQAGAWRPYANPRNVNLLVVQKRMYKKEKITPEKIEAAKAKQSRQSKTFVQKYYEKWGRKKIYGEKKPIPEAGEEEADEDTEITVGEFRTWNEERRAAHFDEWEHANDMCLSIEAREKAGELHLKEPHYWTPVRLAALFKCGVEYMRGLLFEAKLIAEANRRGIPVDDWSIDQGFANIFGTVDFPHDFDDPPDEIPIRKIHNPWYFVDPGLRSAELIKFIRKKETRHYRECSRIPQQQYPKHQEFPEVLGKGVKQQIAPHKSPKWIFYDSSPIYSLYNRPILIRDHDNRWRTPTWDERRKVFMSRTYVRYPQKVPFVYPDESQPDKRAIQDKPPASFSFVNPLNQKMIEDSPKWAGLNSEVEEPEQGSSVSEGEQDFYVPDGPPGEASASVFWANDSGPPVPPSKDFTSRYQIKYDIDPVRRVN